MQTFPIMRLRAFLLLLFVTGLTACASPTPRAPTTQPTSAPSPSATLTSSPATPTSSATPHPTTAPTSAPPTAKAIPTLAPHATASKGFTLDIEPIAQDFKRPVFVTHAGDASQRLFVVEQQGRIFILQNGKRHATPFLDVSSLVTTAGNEQGLLGLAFHPDYKNNGLFYIYYSRKTDNDNVVARYQVSSDPNVADSNSATTILEMEGLEPNHNGGMLAFGPDGYLYIGTGDGGGGGDAHGTIGNGQATDKLLGKILRLDVNGKSPYAIPPDNPLAGAANARPEIWAYGLRNPWRFSFDRATGDLYIGDVGQASYEEVDFQPASSTGGENYGWRIMEGNHCYNPKQDCKTNGLVKPVMEYSHDLGCSITGGYVYRGSAYPWLVGQYIFADYCTGGVWAMARDATGAWQTRRVTTFDDTISSFGQDEAGELYVVGHNNGTIYKLTSQP